MPAPAYDDEACEAFAYHFAEVVHTLDRIDVERGSDVGDEYRRQLAELITGRVRAPQH